ncbi:hypothetical protein, conserved [Leishmania tarentolae]|uniref:Endonuclease/exonuclease/phosphatase domain-containing protein n=1 Tax=Leishmania tarentolae TaxID=5689 RepID=A0A640KF74_LEITA|nr:hypothetical protein, conserved [Leishmania tarentolae]
MSHAPTFATSEVPVRVLTFNLWGIFNSKVREARMKAFAKKIEHYDVLLLQEQFSAEDFDLIFRSAPPEVQRTYAFRRFCSSFYGSGCAVISRYPITQAFFHTFPLQGCPEMLLHGDFFANKGAAMVRVLVPVTMEGDSATKAQEVTLYTTHLVAVYQKVSQMSSWKRERYLPFRISQAISLTDFIVSASRPTDHIIIGGDFNCSQRSLEVQMLLILLKRRGYDMHAVLPPPRAKLDVSMAEQEREDAQPFFTFSDRNAFNSMKTSYFKLLKLEADLPSQIDHIFFSRPAFALRHFTDCPDIADGYPCALPDAPNGIVVFTKNEVHAPPKSTWYGHLWQQLFTGTCAPRVAETKQQPTLWSKATWSTAAQSAEDRAHYYPLSDHFGVAALLGMRVEKVRSTTVMSDSRAAMDGAAALELTSDEARILQTAIDFLEDYVCKLRSQAKVARYIGVTSFLLVTVNLWALGRLSAEEEARSAAVLESMYDMAAATTHGTAKLVHQWKGVESVAHGLNAAKGWVTNQANLTLRMASKLISETAAPGLHPSDTPEGSKRSAAMVASSSQPVPRTLPTPVIDATVQNSTTTLDGDATSAAARPDFRAIAEALMVRPLYASVWVSTAFNMAAAVVGTVSMAIGICQRAGNANILEEQVHQLKKL